MSFVRRRWPALLAATALLVVAAVLGLGRLTGSTAAADTAPTGDTVTVSGVGNANGTPDTLSVDFTVHVGRADVQSTLDAESAAAHKLLAALQSSGVQRSHIQTTDLELYRRYSHGAPIGYTASETLQAQITPLTKAGRTISNAASSSGNVEVGDISFDISNDQSLLSQARANAFSNASDKAKQYATLSGRSLGRVEQISETVANPNQPNVDYASAGAALAPHAAAALPIRLGQQQLTVHVKVVWALS